MTAPQAQKVTDLKELDEIEARRQGCLDAVNLGGQPMERMIAWGVRGAPLIREDIPRLCQALRVALVLHAKHCGMEFCEAEAAILAELSK